MDPIDVLTLGECLTGCVALVAWPLSPVELQLEVGVGGIALFEGCMESLGSGGSWCEMSLIDLLPGRSDQIGWSGDWFHDDWYRLGCELPVLYGLIPLNDAGIVS